MIWQVFNNIIFFQFVTLTALLAVANAGFIPAAPVGHLRYEHAQPLVYAAPVAKTIVTKAVDAEYDPHPQYSFSYDVQDSLTGDSKSQHESRNGDVVEGSYSFVEADGTRRTVHYTADDVNGFNAVVNKEPATVALKTVQPVLHAAPVVHAQPLAYHAQPTYQQAYQVAGAYAAPTYYQH